MHQNKIRIPYKPDLKLNIANQLSRLNHSESKGEEIMAINQNINAIETCIDIPECMKVQEIRHATHTDNHLNVKQHMW